MRWILHRGNTNGPNSVENNPDKLQSLMEQGYEIEIDLWYKDNTFYLGHDSPEYMIDELFLEYPKFWIHCKDANTFEFMNNHR